MLVRAWARIARPVLARAWDRIARPVLAWAWAWIARPVLVWAWQTQDATYSEYLCSQLCLGKSFPRCDRQPTVSIYAVNHVWAKSFIYQSVCLSVYL